MKSGKYSLGYKTVLRSLRNSKGSFLFSGSSFFFFFLPIYIPQWFWILWVIEILLGIAGKLILISNNCPPLRKSEIEYYAMLAKVGVHHFSGSKSFILHSSHHTICFSYFLVSRCCLYVEYQHYWILELHNWFNLVPDQSSNEMLFNFLNLFWFYEQFV